MIDEKKIEEAAEEYRFNTIAQIHNLSYAHKGTVSEEQVNLEIELIESSFVTGINWFLNNLWHTARENPKDGENILIECRNDINKSTYYMTMNPYYCGNFDDEAIIKRETIIRWLYIEDLLKGGK